VKYAEVQGRLRNPWRQQLNIWVSAGNQSFEKGQE